MDEIVLAMEPDSHANSPVVGKNVSIIEQTDKVVKVQGFTSDLGEPLKVPVVNAAVAYEYDYEPTSNDVCITFI